MVYIHLKRMFMVDAYRLEVNYRQIACASALSSLRCRADKDFTEAAFMGSNISYSIGLIAIDQYYYFTSVQHHHHRRGIPCSACWPPYFCVISPFAKPSWAVSIDMADQIFTGQNMVLMNCFLCLSSSLSSSSWQSQLSTNNFNFYTDFTYLQPGA